MVKFSIIVTLVFLLGIWAEWVMLSNPTTGVVLDAEYERASDNFKLNVVTSEGTRMTIKMPPRVWRDWFQIRHAETQK